MRNRALGHVAARIVAGVLVGDGTQARCRVQVVGVSVGYAARRAAGHAIQIVVAERLLVRVDGRAGRSRTAMVTGRRYANVTGLRQAVECVITEAVDQPRVVYRRPAALCYLRTSSGRLYHCTRRPGMSRIFQLIDLGACWRCCWSI